MPWAYAVHCLSLLTWDWDWGNFWSQFIAGLLTFGIGIPYGLVLLRLQRWLDDRKELKTFQLLATTIRDELFEADSAVEAWGEAIRRRARVAPFGAAQLTWEIDDHTKTIFAARGVHAVTNAAVRWYRECVDHVRQWNGELDGEPSEDTTRRATSSIPATRAKLQAAVRALEAAAKLPPTNVKRA